jgi:hypothetical protein
MIRAIRFEVLVISATSFALSACCPLCCERQ